MNGLTIDDIRALPATVDVATAAAALGISRSYAYELAARGELPVRSLAVGGKTRVLTADLMRVLGISPDAREAEPDGDTTPHPLRAVGGTGAA